MVCHALSASADWLDSWILEPGATCYMCNDRKLFVELCDLEKPLEVRAVGSKQVFKLKVGVDGSLEKRFS